ncbi:hypothetical protein PHET_05655 [Paragonimus heterotremus]|uniref:Uncharacterized protein n=1 Tax=Paragonimus heterotremus TaxID=100268 RepID=A0A8J4SNY2_9TREM|nr:hypothetical protein PHET_05655 [Paragonimus heterotremus]
MEGWYVVVVARRTRSSASVDRLSPIRLFLRNKVRANSASEKAASNILISQTMNQAKPLSALVDLHRDLGLIRLTSLVAWQAFGRNIKLLNVNQFDILFISLYINVISLTSLN